MNLRIYNILLIMAIWAVPTLWGCASPSALKGSLAGTVVYTDCPAAEAFEVAYEVMIGEGYTIDIKNSYNYLMRGMKYNLLDNKKQFYMHAQAVPQPAGSKIIIRTDDLHDSSPVWLPGYHTQFSDSVREKITDTLKQRGYIIQRI
ncbi:MAG: hypothetical protein AB1454_12320 [Candidatus Auribacterota bacterium]